MAVGVINVLWLPPSYAYILCGIIFVHNLMIMMTFDGGLFKLYLSLCQKRIQENLCTYIHSDVNDESDDD